MKLAVLRLGEDDKATVGALYIDGVLFSGTIEDVGRDTKVKGETRIPEGTYDVNLRAEGGKHAKYLSKYGADFHKGMLCIHNAPEWKVVNEGFADFQYILIHTGNTNDHTEGCLLLNYGIDTGSYRGSRSGDAYKEIYPIIVKALQNNEQVTITYVDVEPGK